MDGGRARPSVALVVRGGSHFHRGSRAITIDRGPLASKRAVQLRLRALVAHGGLRVCHTEVDDDSVDTELAGTVKVGATRAWSATVLDRLEELRVDADLVAEIRVQPAHIGLQMRGHLDDVAAPPNRKLEGLVVKARG